MKRSVPNTSNPDASVELAKAIVFGPDAAIEMSERAGGEATACADDRRTTRCMSDDVLVRCAGLLDGHVMSYSDHDLHPEGDTSGLGIFGQKRGPTRRISWAEAFGNMPICHGVPMVTEGGWRQLLLQVRIQLFGLPPLQCAIRHWPEAGCTCDNHEWHRGEWSYGGRYSELRSDGTCPHQPLVALLRRRHNLYDGQPSARAIVESGLGLGARHG